MCVSAEPWASGRCYSHMFRGNHLLFGAETVPHHWPVSGEVALATGTRRVDRTRGGADSIREGLGGSWPAPHLPFGCSTCSQPLTGKRARMGLFGLQTVLVPGRGQWVTQICFWPPGARGTNTAVMIFCGEIAPRESRWENRGQNCPSQLRAGGGGVWRKTALWQCLYAHVLPSRVQPSLGREPSLSAKTLGSFAAAD